MIGGEDLLDRVGRSFGAARVGDRVLGVVGRGGEASSKSGSPTEEEEGGREEEEKEGGRDGGCFFFFPQAYLCEQTNNYSAPGKLKSPRSTNCCY